MNGLTAFSERIHQAMNIKVMIVAIVIFLLFMAGVLPLASAVQEKQAGVSETPDTMLFASAQQYYRMAEDFGEAGRSTYIRLRFTFDLAWPAVYGLMLVAVLSVLTRGTAQVWVRRLNLLPVFGVFFDLAENILAVVYMARFPRPTDWAVYLLPFVSAAKWAVLGVSVLAVLVLSVRKGYAVLRQNR